MTVLGIETATDTCGTAIVEDGAVRAEAHLHVPRVHARRLTPLVDDVLAHAEVSDDGPRLAAVDAVAVSMGPGSYTGLRIGVSTAKGWAVAGSLALVGVPTLEAHCARLRPVARPGDVVCGLIDARRDEVYAAAYRVAPGDAPDDASAASPNDPANDPERDSVNDPAAHGPIADGLRAHVAPVACATSDLPACLGAVDGHLWVVGDGGAKSRDVLADRYGPALTVLSPTDVPPSAASVARCAFPRLAAGATGDVAVFEPFYLKDFHGTPAPDPL